MNNPMKKIFSYTKVRLYEFRLVIREFKKGSKTRTDVRSRYADSWELVTAHSVEKGLGLDKTEPGHSGDIVIQLLDKLLSVVTEEKARTFSFKETLRILLAYMDYQEQFDTSKFSAYSVILKKYQELEKILGQKYISDIRKELDAGSVSYSKDELLRGSNFDFERFINSRHSIRSFASEPLETELIRKAVTIANCAPSACNRQPSYVYFCNNPTKVSVIDSMITGSNGFKGEVPNYIIVTTDRACFSYVEEFQWYINGGIYLSYLSLALHSLGVGHCIMQWKAFYKTEHELKKLLGISDTEAIIAVIGCGHYKDETRCICAQRKDAEEVLKIVQ